MGEKERLLEYFKRLTQAEKDAIVGKAAELCQDKEVFAYPPLNKREFLATELGSKMANIIVEWDQVMHDYYGGLVAWENNPGLEKKFIQCLAQWEVCQIVMRQFYGNEYHFTRTDEYFGICTEDGSDWLVKVFRGPATGSTLAPEYITDILSPANTDNWRSCYGEDVMPKAVNITKKKFVPQGNSRHALCKKLEREATSDAAEIDEYYEGIINSKLPARTGMEKAIQGLTLKDAGVVLVMIGMEHPASRVVYKYLVDQKLKQYDGSRCYLLNWWRCIPSDKSLHSECLDTINTEELQITYHANGSEIRQALKNLRCQCQQSE